MSQQNKEPRLPTGGMLDKDLSTLTDEALKHEHDLAYEVLHDIHCSYPPWDGGVAIKGMLKEVAENSERAQGEQFQWALQVWKLRLKRAEDELERRYLLS